MSILSPLLSSSSSEYVDAKTVFTSTPYYGLTCLQFAPSSSSSSQMTPRTPTQLYASFKAHLRRIMYRTRAEPIRARWFGVLHRAVLCAPWRTMTATQCEDACAFICDSPVYRALTHALQQPEHVFHGAHPLLLVLIVRWIAYLATSHPTARAHTDAALTSLCATLPARLVCAFLRQPRERRTQPLLEMIQRVHAHLKEAHLKPDRHIRWSAPSDIAWTAEEVAVCARAHAIPSEPDALRTIYSRLFCADLPCSGNASLWHDFWRQVFACEPTRACEWLSIHAETVTLASIEAQLAAAHVSHVE
jgi:hypothetical protein